MLDCFVKVAPNPANSLESHSCTFSTLNSRRITFLRKNRGGVPPTANQLHVSAPSANSVVNLLPPVSPILLAGGPILDDKHLRDWIHLPSNRMQESPATARTVRIPTRKGICHHERSEGSAFRFLKSALLLAPSQSPVDTTRILPYSAPANDFASPSPPSSSRHSAALDDVCIAIRYHTVLITRWRNGPAGFLFLCTLFVIFRSKTFAERLKS